MTDNPKSTFAKRVRAARPRARRYDGWDDVISGLGLCVATSGHRSFFLRRTVRGRIRSATIGSADDMTLPEARAEARKLIASFVEPARKGTGRRGPSAGHRPSLPSAGRAGRSAITGQYCARSRTHVRIWAQPRTCPPSHFCPRLRRSPRRVRSNPSP